MSFVKSLPGRSWKFSPCVDGSDTGGAAGEDAHSGLTRILLKSGGNPRGKYFKNSRVVRGGVKVWLQWEYFGLNVCNLCFAVGSLHERTQKSPILQSHSGESQMLVSVTKFSVKKAIIYIVHSL